MALATYTDLIAEVGNILHRSDLAVRMPTFVAMAEHAIFSDLDSRMQDTVAVLSTVASTETLAVPADFINARSITVMASPNISLDYKSPDQYQKEFPWGNNGTPLAYTLIGANFYLAPIPDSVYPIRLAYQQKVPSLLTNSTNWLLTNFPAVYLYATLTAACSELKDDASLQKWAGAYKLAIEGVNGQDWASASTLRVKSDNTA